MRFLVIFVVLIVTVASELDKDVREKLVAKVKEMVDTCAKEVSADQDDIDALLSHKIPTSDEGKCLLFCLHKDIKIQNEDGTLNKELSWDVLDTIKKEDEELFDKFASVLKKCSEEVEVEANPCETAHNWAECAVKEKTHLGIEHVLFDEIE